MKVIFTALGILFLAAAVFCVIARVTNPTLFARLDALQASIGEHGATALYVFAFIVLPGMIGMALLAGGLM